MGLRDFDLINCHASERGQSSNMLISKANEIWKKHLVLQDCFKSTE